MTSWFDVEKFMPVIRATVELSNGEQVQATFTCGTWEDEQGRAIRPVRFQPPTIVVNVGLYKAPFDIE